MEIGNRIRQFRYRSSLTQEQLAERLGLSAQAVSKWENNAAMPDITLLPDLAEIFGVSIDELFDLTADQKYRRIESRMDREDELEPDIFREYEEFLKEQISIGKDTQRALSMLAHLYHHRLETYAKKAARYARQAVSAAPDKKDCQWILSKAEGSAVWDWNVANHSRTIEFFKQIIAENQETEAPLPYYYLIDNLLADHRTAEAREYINRLAKLPLRHPCMIPVYEAAAALAEYDEQKADAIMEKAIADFRDDPAVLFEAAQYYARKCNYEKAVSYYEANFAAEENNKPRYTDPLEGIALIYEITGDYRKAAETQERLLQVLKSEWGFTEETLIRDTEKKIADLRAKI